MVKKYHAYKQVAQFTLTARNSYRKDYATTDRHFIIREAFGSQLTPSKVVEKFYYKLQAEHVKLSPNARLAVLRFGFNIDTDLSQNYGQFERPMTVHISNILNKNEVKVVKSDGSLDKGNLGAHLLTIQDLQNYTNPNPEMDFIELRNYPNFLNGLIEVVVDCQEYSTVETEQNGQYKYHFQGPIVFGFPEIHSYNITLVVYDIDEEVLNEGMSVYENKTYQFHNQAQQGSKYQI